MLLSESLLHHRSFALDGYAIPRNILSLEEPDAQSRQKLGVGEDPRARGVNLKWIELN